jgi:spore maturation protein CgeB
VPLRILQRLFGPFDWAGANAAILASLRARRADLLWIDKGLTIAPDTLRRAKAIHPALRIAGYTPDDMTGNPRNSSRRFRRHLPLYDVYFTTKSYGVSELTALGARRAVFVGNAYDPRTHRPVELTSQDRERYGGPVGFIGGFEQERAGAMLRLAEAGILVRVWGEYWERFPARHSNLKVEFRPVMGDAYARATCAFDINLGFLRKVNRDLQTTRSIEIPACGAFLLAERTSEHLALFEEGKEAEYFDGDAELLAKVRYYLAHPESRQRIAAAGLARCRTSGYGNVERLRGMLDDPALRG